MPPIRSRSTAIKYHEFYDNSYDTIHLRSNDNIYFKANKGRLIKSSMFFSDLLDEAGPITCPNDEDHPIDLDFASPIISTYLDIINVSTPYLVEIPYHTCKLLYALCDFTMSIQTLDTVRTMLLSSSAPKNTSQMIDLFKFACNVNDVELGKSVFSMFYQDATSKMNINGGKPKENSDPFLLMAKRLRPSWKLALFYALMQIQREQMTSLGISGKGTSARWTSKSADPVVNVRKYFNPAEFDQ
ncbi:uncharacterized protein I206_100585 [Kwoniella pini CBS 10737]|uniref:BTB domain-containing protein n=1 Tax=Kwoniella pini CBS 10737 TaxID=1296096 RepID=A0A1B9ID91_9TREE|nr:uncharacterized protein I206_00740 [Kwoniella pini CBS 10737]OCF53437.1 hypothetical protein I206_00740 [Kwoniella pini CBS 10737]